MRRGLLGRAELVDALALLPAEDRDAAIGLMHWNEILVEPNADRVAVQEPPVWSFSADSDSPATEVPAEPIPAMAFWRAVQFQRRVDAPKTAVETESAPKRQIPTEPVWRGQIAGRKAPFVPLCSWNVLHARLRAALSEFGISTQPDVPRVVRQVAEGRQITSIPKRKARKWGGQVQLIFDLSTRLVSLFDDQNAVAAKLESLLGRTGLQYASGGDPDHLWSYGRDGTPTAYVAPNPGTLVVIVGDLGSLDAGGHALARRWALWGERLSAEGCLLVALVPCSEERVPKDLRRIYRIVAWQQDATAWIRGAKERAAAVERILSMLAPFCRVEPGILRAVRLLLPNGGDASLEAEVVQHSAVESPHPTALVLRRKDVREKYLPAFDSPEFDGFRGQVLQILRDHRHELPAEIALGEIAGLSQRNAALLSESEKSDVSQFIQCLHQIVHGSGDTDSAAAGFCRRMISRIPDAAAIYKESDHGLKLRELHRLLEPDAIRQLPGFDPNEVKAAGATQDVQVWQVGRQLRFTRSAHPLSNRAPFVGHWLGAFRTANGWVTVRPDKSIDRDAFWKAGAPPHWAHDWGWDQYGAWATIRFQRDGHDPIEQKVRWIPPGDFLMGSGEGEEGRLYREGPQHRVTIGMGFWLFDTPVTQALWVALMGWNPSSFKGEKRPVEQVSYRDCRNFLRRAANAPFNLEMELPTEAQWEFACRAGTTTRYSCGDNITSLQARYHPSDGTVDVASFAANPYGLFDMHGNVYEWCKDGLRDYSQHPAVDPIGPTDERVPQAIRGGGWYVSALHVRSACRYWSDSADRNSHLGFRCIVVQDSANLTEPNPKPADEAQDFFLGPADTEVPFPDAPRLLIRSDVDDLRLEKIARPSWAVAAGRDQYGLWADFEVSSTDNPAKKPVRQRVRWIPPGRFLMGSAESEKEEWGRDNEHPQHEVQLTRGFWLFDVPCRQSLFETLRMDNPSRFKDGERPVERVDFNAAMKFCRRLQQALEITHRPLGLTVRLPTEAEWEYACRAGSSTAIYTGDLKIEGLNNGPALHPIAWYGGNSGVEFDRQDGVDSTGWREKQFGHAKAGTRKVGLKAPNSWGLYDMLGNVWEWCFDGRRKYTEAAVSDPLEPTAADAPRAVRGGGWYDGSARELRCACRNSDVPASRFNDLGFRCALVQDFEQEGRP